MAERNKPEGAGSPSTTGMGLRAPIGRVAAPLRDQVLQVVREAILDFRLRPGQRLIERELMEQLSVSRATVREVLAQLASEGLVTNIPQRGAIVSVLTTDEAADIYEMRVALESLAVRRFVERATEEHMSRLRAALEELEAARKSEGADLARLIAKDELYKALFAGADSPPLTQMLTSLQGRLRRLRWTSCPLRGGWTGPSPRCAPWSRRSRSGTSAGPWPPPTCTCATPRRSRWRGWRRRPASPPRAPGPAPARPGAAPSDPPPPASV